MLKKIITLIRKIIYSIGYVLLVEARYRYIILEQFEEKSSE